MTANENKVKRVVFMCFENMSENLLKEKAQRCKSKFPRFRCELKYIHMDLDEKHVYLETPTPATAPAIDKQQPNHPACICKNFVLKDLLDLLFVSFVRMYKTCEINVMPWACKVKFLNSLEFQSL